MTTSSRQLNVGAEAHESGLTILRGELRVLLGVAVIAAAMAAIAGWLAVSISQPYYAAAPYHYDSAAYLLRGADIYQLGRSSGLAAALAKALRNKDSLDITLRLLLLPQALNHRYGHLAVLLAYMAAFLALLLWYVYTRTGDWLAALATAAFLFTFPLIYDPYWGISSPWKDNMATWLFASAMLCWLLAQHLQRWRWMLLCGLFLGLLVAQRSAVAVYAVMLCTPLLLWSLVLRARRDGWTFALRTMVAFALPAAALGILVGALQWQNLYEYYFVRGYAYNSPWQVARYLAEGFGYGAVQPWVGFFVGIPYGIGYTPFLVLVLAAALLVVARKRHSSLGEFAAMLWLVIGLPLVVIATRTMFHGFYAIWTPLLVLLLATLIVATNQPGRWRIMLAGLLALAVVVAVMQDCISSQQYQKFAAQRAPLRRFYVSIGHILTSALPPNAPFGLLTGYSLSLADLVLLRDQVIFNEGHYIPDSLVRPERQDSYYRAVFGQLGSAQIIERSMRGLRQRGALVIGECRSDAIPPDAENPLAHDVLTGLSQHVLEDPHWRAVGKVRQRVGCVIVYRYSSTPLSLDEKWKYMVTYQLDR